MIQTIAREELRDLIGRDAVTVVEALAEVHFRREHLPGAVNVPPDASDELIADVLADRAAPIVTYCAHLKCLASEGVAQRLAALGYANVRDYPEGKADWVSAGLPVERATEVNA
jgi:rhodanese-related sulfurtransferase